MNKFKKAAEEANYYFYYDRSLRLWVLYHKENLKITTSYLAAWQCQEMGVEKFKALYLSE